VSGQKENDRYMKTFRVDAKNRVRAMAATSAGQEERSSSFASEAELERLAASWPSSRLVEIWNGLPGVTAVRRFTSRGAGVRRIWNAVQMLEPSKTERHAPSGAGSRKEQMIAMLRTAGGATLPQLMQASGWQAHSDGEGFVIHCEFVTNASTTHGSGACKDNKDRLYRLMF
jgi:hypothetical protein